MNRQPSYNLNDFDYKLPEDLIAQEPCVKRDESSILIPGNSMSIVPFSQIAELFDERDTLVINVSKVLKARIKGECIRTGRVHEVLMIRPISCDVWQAMINNSRKLKIGDTLELGEGQFFSLKILEKGKLHKVLFRGDSDVFELLERKGTIPLPPYIKRQTSSHNDEIRYQTVYAKLPGSAAAPTAGLHITEEFLDKLFKKGVSVVPVVLHVGPGTFAPVKANCIEDHEMHEEWIELSEDASLMLNQAIESKRRITAIGTTSLRVLESCFIAKRFFPYKGLTRLFIHPPKTIQSVDRLITNFHMPKSTLFMLVSAFSGLERVQEIYRFAIEARMRFFSYGDAMILENAYK